LLLETHGHEGHCVLLQHGGQAEWRQGSGCQSLNPGEALIGPGHAWSLTTSLSSSSCFLADPHRLLRTARAMGGPQGQPVGPAESVLHQPLPLPAQRDLAGRGVLEAFSRLLPFISAIAHQGEGLVQALHLDDQIYRLLAALVFADLRDGEQPSPALADRKRTDACIDDLVDFIRLNLHHRLCLSDLERQSMYSRRALHYAFRARFDCSPMQWVRQQRLARALDRLQNPLQGESVLGVALACGYRSLSQFSVDFQRAYQRKPSEVLRRGRIQNQPAPGALDAALADIAPAP
jgi:AraC-like DNA-binding protein